MFSQNYNLFTSFDERLARNNNYSTITLPFIKLQSPIGHSCIKFTIGSYQMNIFLLRPHNLIDPDYLELCAAVLLMLFLFTGNTIATAVHQY